MNRGRPQGKVVVNCPACDKAGQKCGNGRVKACEKGRAAAAEGSRRSARTRRAASSSDGVDNMFVDSTTEASRLRQFRAKKKRREKEEDRARAKDAKKAKYFSSPFVSLCLCVFVSLCLCVCLCTVIALFFAFVSFAFPSFFYCPSSIDRQGGGSGSSASGSSPASTQANRWDLAWRTQTAKFCSPAAQTRKAFGQNGQPKGTRPRETTTLGDRGSCAFSRADTDSRPRRPRTSQRRPRTRRRKGVLYII